MNVRVLSGDRRDAEEVTLMLTDPSEPRTASILRSGIKWWGGLDGSPEQSVLKIKQQF